MARARLAGSPERTGRVRHDGLRDSDSALTDTRADEDTVAAELHHEGSVSGGGDTTGGERDDGETLEAGSLLEEVVGSLDLLGEGVELVVRHGGGAADVGHDGALVLDGLDDVAGAGLTLGADHAGGS